MELLLVIFFLIALIITVIASIFYTLINKDDGIKTTANISGTFLIVFSLILTIWHVVEFLNTH
jgi:hypothetical protein